MLRGLFLFCSFLFFSLSLPRCFLAAGDVVRLYVHPTRGFRTLEGKNVRQLAAEDDFLLVDLTLHYWTIFEELTGKFDFSSSTLFPPKRKEGGKNAQTWATSSRPAAVSCPTSSMPSTVDGDDLATKAMSQQTSSVSSTHAPVKIGEKNSSSQELVSKTESEAETKDQPGCFVCSDVNSSQERTKNSVCEAGKEKEKGMRAVKREDKEEEGIMMITEGRGVGSSEKESKKKDGKTEAVGSEEKQKPNTEEGGGCCNDAVRGHVFLFSYSCLKNKDAVWMDEKAPEDSRSYYHYQPYSDYGENRDLTEVEIAYILESSYPHVSPMASTRGREGENRENAAGGDNKIIEEGMLDDSTTTSSGSSPCCSSLPTSPSCCYSHLDYQDHDSPVSLPGHLSSSCTSDDSSSSLSLQHCGSLASASSSSSGRCDSPSPPRPSPLSETCSTGTSNSSDAEQSSSPPQLCKEEAPSDASRQRTEKETVTVCRFRLDEDEAPFPGLEILARHMRVGDMADAWLSGSFVVPTSSFRHKDEGTQSQRNQAYSSHTKTATSSLSGTTSFSPSLHLQKNGDTETSMPRCLSSSLCPSNGINFPTKADAISTTSIPALQVDKRGHDSTLTDEGMRCGGLTSYKEEKKEERQLRQLPPCCLSLRRVVLRKAEHVPEPHQLRFVQEKMDMAKVFRVNGSGWYKKGRPDRALKRYLQVRCCGVKECRCWCAHIAFLVG